MSFRDGGIKYNPIETSLGKSLKRWLVGKSLLSIVQLVNMSTIPQNLTEGVFILKPLDTFL